MLWLAPIALAVVDQVIKHWFLSNPQWTLSYGQGLRVFLSLYHNTVAAFSLPVPARLVAMVSTVVVVGIVYLLIKSPSQKLRLALLFLLCGALSNLVDRFRLGSVVDYLGVGIGNLSSSTFNLADISIVAGIIGWWWVGRDQDKPSAVEAAGQPPVDTMGK